MTETLDAPSTTGLARITPRRTRIGPVAGAWSATGIAHHWALGAGHRVGHLRPAADLLGLRLTVV